MPLGVPCARIDAMPTGRRTKLVVLLGGAITLAVVGAGAMMLTRAARTKYRVHKLISSGDAGMPTPAMRQYFGGRTEEAVPYIAEYLRNGTYFESLKASSILGRLGDNAVVPYLLESATGAQNELVRANSISGLIRTRDPRAAPAFVAGLEDPNSSVRYWSAEGLGLLRHRPAVPQLVKALDDPDASVRAKVARSLGKIGDRAAIGALRRRFESEEVQRIKAAYQAAIRQLETSGPPPKSSVGP